MKASQALEVGSIPIIRFFPVLPKEGENNKNTYKIKANLIFLNFFRVQKFGEQPKMPTYQHEVCQKNESNPSTEGFFVA